MHKVHGGLNSWLFRRYCEGSLPGMVRKLPADGLFSPRFPSAFSKVLSWWTMERSPGGSSIPSQLPELQTADSWVPKSPLQAWVLYSLWGSGKEVSLEPEVTRHDSLGLGWSFSENCFWATSLSYLWRKAKIRGENKVSGADCNLDFLESTLLFSLAGKQGEVTARRKNTRDVRVWPLTCPSTWPCRDPPKHRVSGSCCPRIREIFCALTQTLGLAVNFLGSLIGNLDSCYWIPCPRALLFQPRRAGK